MVLIGSIYLRQGLVVRHCGYFLIHMGLRYPKNMFFLKVYQQNVLCFCRIWEFFCNNVYLQKRVRVILFWCEYKTIKCFLRYQENLIYFLIINILRRVVLILLMRVIVMLFVVMLLYYFLVLFKMDVLVKYFVA